MGQTYFCSPNHFFLFTQVEIEATVVGWRGDIAIDELQFIPGGCPLQALTTTAAPRDTTPTTPESLPVPPPFSKNQLHINKNNFESSVGSNLAPL